MNNSFASVRKPRFAVRPTCAAVLALVSFQYSAAYAQSELPAVTVTATRTESRIDQTVADTTVISKEDIARATGRTLAEVLANARGVQMNSNGGLGMASSVGLRGMESRHTLVLIDGIRFGSATLGTPILDNIPLDEIERIEIVRGPLSSLYGTDALGGVIQIFTRRGQQGLRFNGALTAGSNDYGKGTAGVSFGDGRWSGAAQVSHVETRGFSSTNDREPFGNHDPDRDGFYQNAANVRLGLQLSKDWQANASAVHSRSRHQFDDGPGANARGTTTSEVLGFDLTGNFRPGWRAVTRVARSSDNANIVESASMWTDLGSIINVQQQVSHEQSIDTGIGTVLLLADHVKQKVDRPVTPYEVSRRTINGVGAGLNGHAQGHTWQANLRHDRNSQFGNKTTGALGYAYELSSAWRLGGSFGTSFVAPSFNQLYWPGFSNPNLLPEEGKSAELNLRFQAANYTVRVELFETRVDNFITSGVAPVNIPKTQTRGLSVGLDTHVAGLDLSASLDHVDPRNRDTAGGNSGKLLPRKARNAARVSVDGGLGQFRAGATLAAFSGRYDDAGNTNRLGGYGRLDLRADWRFNPELSLGVNLNNVADKVYETAYGYNQPGREVYVSLRFTPK